MQSRSRKRTIVRAACAVLAALAAHPASAHVKWFVDYDLSQPPLLISRVLTGTFVELLLASTFSVYLFFVLDRYIYKKRYLAPLDQRLRRLDGAAIGIVRISAGLFFIALWLWHLKFGTDFYLTPELETGIAAVPWLQLVLGLCALSHYTSPITGVGILVLFSGALRDFGAYHMMDYVVFIGIGYFFLVSNIQRGQWKKSGFIVLFASTGLSLIWGAMEKFAYPQWAYPLLEQHAYVLMGMSPEFYMVLAGFIEFNVTFILLGAASVLGRLVALGFESIFVLGILVFGWIDAIGHVTLIAILFILVVRGPTEAREMLVLRDKTVWTEAYFMTGLYFLALVMLFVLYYGLHHIVYGV